MTAERRAIGSAGLMPMVLARLSSLPRGVILLMALASTAGVWVVDLVTGEELSISIFYLLPVALSVWYIGRRAAVAISVVGGVLWFVAERMAGVVYSQPAIPVWNALVRLGFFLIVTFVLAALRRALRAQEELARLDPLTGLANLRHFMELAGAELQRARRYGHPISVAYLDVDDFKLVNDRLGHQKGDELLHLVAVTTSGNIRSVDIAARLGGDEFALLLPETSQDAAARVVEKLRSALHDATKAFGFKVTVSVGCITFSEPPETMEELLGRADRLMYEAKRSGKDAVAFESASEGERERPSDPSLTDPGIGYG